MNQKYIILGKVWKNIILKKVEWFETTTPLIETNLLLLTRFQFQMKNSPLTK
jgi:hypothetical protein